MTDADFEKLQETHKLTTPLTVAVDKDGPPAYELNKEAAVTVLVYKDGGKISQELRLQGQQVGGRKGPWNRRGRRGVC